MKFELGTLKRYAGALVFGVALLVGASATANAQHGGYQNNGHARRDVRHERRDDRRELNHHQRDNRNYGYNNSGGYYNQGGGYNNNGGYYNQRGGYNNNGYYGSQRNNHHNRRHH